MVKKILDLILTFTNFKFAFIYIYYKINCEVFTLFLSII